MRLAITTDHKNFFQKNGFIELEGMLSQEQIVTLKMQADETLAARLKLTPAKMLDRPASELYQAGYDLWRSNDTLKKTSHKKDFALLASELFATLPLRCGFDQYICTSRGTPFSQTLSLQEISCLSPLAGALLLPLDNLLQAIPQFPLPLNAGSGLYISPSLPIPWLQLFSTPDLRLLIIGYATKRTLFRPDTRDPNAVQLKRLGYVFNDRLKDALHPILARKA